MKHIIRIVSLSSLLCLAVFTTFIYKESQVVVAATASDNVIVTLQVDAGITITDSPNITLSNTIGVSNDEAVGTSTWNVKTNNTLGYFLTVQASTRPAMTSGSNFVEDFATSSAPATWSVSSGDARFGFSAFGTDVSTSKWGTGSFCNGAATSTHSTTLKYSGFINAATTTANRSSTTTTAGIDTTVCYAAQQNGYYIPSGTYTATITATATTN